MGGVGGEKQEGRYTGVRGNLGVIDVFISLVVMVVLLVYSGVKLTELYISTQADGCTLVLHQQSCSGAGGRLMVR